MNNSSPFAIDTILISPDGVIIAAYSESCENLIGEDVSQREYIRQVLKTEQPVMSGVFNTIEGYPEIEMDYPVFSEEGVFLGMVSLLIGQTELFKEVIFTADPLENYEIFALETDGNIVYDLNKSPHSPDLNSQPELIQWA